MELVVSKMLPRLIEKYEEGKIERALIKLIDAVDSDEIPNDWAKKEMAEAIELGLTDGSNPKMFATRQEVEIMVKRGMK